MTRSSPTRNPTESESPPGPVLEVEDLAVSYRGTPVLESIRLRVWPYQIVALVGPNGAGKTTLLKAIGGVVPLSAGRVLFCGQPVHLLPAHRVVQRGMIYIPEGMRVFPQMSVMENLEIGAYLHRKSIPERLELVFGLFPELYEKRNSPSKDLSGGEQHMLTLARGLMARARLLLLDDPFMNLSPKIIRRFCDAFRLLSRRGVTLVIASQHVRRILHAADLAYLIEDGRITLSGPGLDVLGNVHLQHILLGSLPERIRQLDPLP